MLEGIGAWTYSSLGTVIKCIAALLSNLMNLISALLYDNLASTFYKPDPENNVAAYPCSHITCLN